jgi:hypothetical protein
MIEDRPQSLKFFPSSKQEATMALKTNKLKNLFKPLLDLLASRKKADVEQDALIEEVLGGLEQSAKVNAAVLEYLKKRESEQGAKIADWKKRIANLFAILVIGVLSGAFLQAIYGDHPAVNFLTGSNLL